MENTPTLNLLEKFNRWIQDSIMVKLLSIGLLILILLIPTAWITSIIYERQQRAEQVTDEIANKWADAQTLTGPVLVIPYRVLDIIDKGADGKETRERVEKAFFLPEQLDVSGTIEPEQLHRGIFDAVVYKSSIKFKSVFAQPDFEALDIADEMVNWKDAYLVFGITDLRGISQDPVFVVGGQTRTAEPSNNIGISVRRTARPAPDDYTYREKPAPGNSTKGIVAPLNWQRSAGFSGDVSVDLNLKGSQRLDFIPTGKTTNVSLTSPWSTPSFDGEFLPASRQVTDDGFSAQWKVLHFNRPLAQQWTKAGEEITGADFGVRLLVPVDQYQKSIRTAKYGIMIILLTFMALFLVEITQKIRIHPFQYILIGAALIIYYTLLLSFSEHVGYNMAYLIASVATVALITLYATTFFHTRKLTVLLAALLVVFYAFVYIIILQEDLSLLIGSVGLFLIIAALMYFSRKVRYYGETATTDSPHLH